MSKTDIKKKFDEIVDFSDVEQFLDTPVKRYSSGMYIRLAFAIAAHMDPDILVVDEVLAVGDAMFQKKCLGKMKAVSKGGRTVLFVSHNMGTINELCGRCLWLHDGIIKYNGKTSQAIFNYFNSANVLSRGTFRGTLAQEVYINKILINNQEGSSFVQVSPGEDIEIRVQGKCKHRIEDIKISLTLSVNGSRIITLSDSDTFAPLPSGDFESFFLLPRYIFRPGEYMIGAGGDRSKSGYWFYGDNLALLHIAEEWDEICVKKHRGIINIIHPDLRIERV